MARKKDDQVVKRAYKEERKAKSAQKKSESGGASEPYLQPNDVHFVSFKNQLATMGLMLRDIPGDGNCLFRALNDQLEGHSRNHLRLRHDTVRFMIDHKADFEPFVEDDVPFQTHVHQLSQPGTYGGHDALVAFARMTKRNIVIHQLNSPLWQIEGGPSGCPQLHLSYHNGEHYSSVRRAGDTSESAANIRLNATVGADADPSTNKARKMNLAERSISPCGAVAAGGAICNDDDIVQRISRETGCRDLVVISETLVDYDGDEQSATDYILGVMMATNSDHHNVDETPEEDQAAASAAKPEKNFSSGASKLKAPVKKLTNRQRKQQNRIDKLSRSKDKESNGKTSGGEPVEDGAIVESAFGCLRI